MGAGTFGLQALGIQEAAGKVLWHNSGLVKPDRVHNGSHTWGG
jgi:hypothetical protein